MTDNYEILELPGT